VRSETKELNTPLLQPWCGGALHGNLLVILESSEGFVSSQGRVGKVQTWRTQQLKIITPEKATKA